MPELFLPMSTRIKLLFSAQCYVCHILSTWEQRCELYFHPCVMGRDFFKCMTVSTCKIILIIVKYSAQAGKNVLEQVPPSLAVVCCHYSRYYKKKKQTLTFFFLFIPWEWTLISEPFEVTYVPMLWLLYDWVWCFPLFQQCIYLLLLGFSQVIAWAHLCILSKASSCCISLSDSWRICLCYQSWQPIAFLLICLHLFFLLLFPYNAQCSSVLSCCRKHREIQKYQAYPSIWIFVRLRLGAER